MNPSPTPTPVVDDPVTVPRGLIGAACAAIERKHDAPKTLAELRRYTFGDLSSAAIEGGGEAAAPGAPKLYSYEIHEDGGWRKHWAEHKPIMHQGMRDLKEWFAAPVPPPSVSAPTDEQIDKIATFIYEPTYIHHRYGVTMGDDTYSCATWPEALDKWAELVRKHPDKWITITGWNYGVIASHDIVRDLFAAPTASSQCPICYRDTPHEHTGEEIQEHRQCEKSRHIRNAEHRANVLASVAKIEQRFGQRPNLNAVLSILAATQGKETGA